jgi:hypothetical protein
MQTISTLYSYSLDYTSRVLVLTTHALCSSPYHGYLLALVTLPHGESGFIQGECGFTFVAPRGRASFAAREVRYHVMRSRDSYDRLYASNTSDTIAVQQMRDLTCSMMLYDPTSALSEGLVAFVPPYPPPPRLSSPFMPLLFLDVVLLHNLQERSLGTSLLYCHLVQLQIPLCTLQYIQQSWQIVLLDSRYTDPGQSIHGSVSRREGMRMEVFQDGSYIRCGQMDLVSRKA